MDSSSSGHTRSLWVDTADVPDFPALKRNARADVCVVGAGIAGMTTAYLLMKAGKKVVVIDDGPIAGGETSRTTAHLTWALDDRYYMLERAHGEQGARYAAESHMAAVHRIEGIVKLEGIDCDFERLDGYLFPSVHDDATKIDRELEATHHVGLVDVQRIERVPIPTFNAGPALRFPNQGQFHPLKYMAGLALAIKDGGGRIFCSSHVTKVEGGKEVSVETDEHHTVRADAVCVCTNASISDYVHTHTKQAAYRTYVCAFRVPRGSIPRALYWDTPWPYHYVRLQAVDDIHDALIVGGEDHKTGQADDMEERWRCLEEWARERFPTIEGMTHRWSGQVLEPFDGMAFIGRNPDGAENVYMASGDSGNGMTHGTVAGMLLTDLVMGRENPWEKLYDPKRIRVERSTLIDFLKENINVAAQYLDYVKPGEVKSLEDIPRGEGRVIGRGKHKIAAYRDDDGKIHERSAVCTHLGCIVDWNPGEKSWDCPCHGSRFDPTGTVLNGPAISELKPVEE
jgi:glycine/D-amino acid oxidase-like deaminating enzyme/nitrite reductase/ring-hydroxylating ferredoxin subunit